MNIASGSLGKDGLPLFFQQLMRSPAPAYVNVVMREDVCEYALHVSQRFAFLFLPDSPIVRASKIQIVRSSIPVCWCGAVALQLAGCKVKPREKCAVD